MDVPQCVKYSPSDGRVGVSWSGLSPTGCAFLCWLLCGREDFGEGDGEGREIGVLHVPLITNHFRKRILSQGHPQWSLRPALTCPYFET